MNIHEHQAKQILKKYGAVIPDGVFAHSVEELVEKAKTLKSKKLVLKAQIHAGGRGKAGGVKILNSIDELHIAAQEMLGKKLITHQTGPEGKEVKRLYIEEASEISKEYYLSCLIDRESSKIAFISSKEGGMDIEKVASENPEKIITNKIDLKDQGPDDKEIENIVSTFEFSDEQKVVAYKLIKSLYKILVEKEKLTLTVPINQQSKLRPIASINQINKCISILKTKPKIKRTMWSRRAQEYEQKINSGKIYELAEVVKDLNKNTDIIADQSYSERQLFEKAYDRLKSEFEAVLKINPEDVQKKMDKALGRIKISEVAE